MVTIPKHKILGLATTPNLDPKNCKTCKLYSTVNQASKAIILEWSMHAKLYLVKELL